MLEGFAGRSESEFVRWMSEDFTFVSDDPDFRAARPRGMSREDERAFAARLFHGGGADGPAPAVAARIDFMGPMTVVGSVDSGTAQVRVVLLRFRALLELADGTEIDLGDTRGVMDLVHTASGWLVHRWSEARSPRAAGSPDEPIASRMPQAADSGDPESMAESAEPESAGTARQWDSAATPTTPDGAASAALPERLAIEAWADRGRNAWMFDLTLPLSGGLLELFDVMGRRIARRDLSGLGPGRHTVAVDGASYPSGVYWARARQGSVTAAARVVWAR